MSFYFKGGNNLSRYTSGDNGDTVVSKDSVEQRDAEGVFDRLISNFDGTNNSNFGQQNYRLLGKHLAIRFPQQLTIENLKQIYYRDPIAFIAVLHEISPFFKSTVDLYSLMATNGKFTINVRGEDGKVDEKASKEAESFWKNQPLDVGSLSDFVGKMLLEFCFFADGCAFQGIGVTGDETGELGYAYVKPFSTNTTLVGLSPTNEIGLYQRTRNGKTIELTMAHTFWQPHEPTLQSPNGTYAMSAGVIEGLAELITARDLRDGIRGAGSPVRLFRYDRDALIKTAVETMGITIRAGQKLAQFVKDQISTIESYAKNRRNAESLVVAKDVNVENVAPVDFNGVLPAIEHVTNRTANAWGTMPNMFGHGEATKQNLQYQLVAQRIDYKRAKVLRLIEKCTEQHFLLMGRVVEVEVVPPAIHLTDQLVAENTRQMKFLNELMRFGAGLIDNETFSRNITGESPAGTPLEGAIDAMLKVAKPGGLDNNNSNQAEKTGGKTGKPPTK